VGQGDGLVDGERGVPVLDADRALVLGAGLDPQLGLALARRLGLAVDLGLVKSLQLGVNPGRTAQVGLAGRVVGIEELAVEGLEVLAADRIAVAEAEVGGAIADPDPGRLAALLDGGEVVACALAAGECGAVDGADRLPRVRGIMAAGDADYDCHGASSACSGLGF
jgi:hypothetical protein